MLLKTALHFSRELLEKVVQPGDFVVDATMGNGHDTLLLAELVGTEGLVWSFDIQPAALAATNQLLSENGARRQVQLFSQGHETLAELLPSAPQNVSSAIFNLGYLPKSDKTITTQADTTLTALTALLTALKPGGLVLLVVYYGHVGGEAEKVAVSEFCQKLPQDEFNVLTYQFVNQRNTPPILLAIEKK